MWPPDLSSDIEIRVKVKPSAKSDKIEGWMNDGKYNILKISIRKSPEKGKANDGLIKFLAQELKIHQKSITIKSGYTSHYKTICIKSSIN